MGFNMQIVVSQACDEAGYRVEERDGCRIVHGSVPIQDIGRLTKGLHRKAVMSAHAANLLFATFVIGTPEAIDSLIASTPRPRVPDSWREALGGACVWVEEGRVGTSSNFLLNRLTGFDALGWLHDRNLTQSAVADYGHPRDVGDLHRCRLLLESNSAFQPRLGEMADASEHWHELVAVWVDLCASMDEEAPDWRSSESFTAQHTQALMDRVLGVPARKAGPAR